MHNNVQIYHFKLPFMGRQMQANMIHDTGVVYIYIYIGLNSSYTWCNSKQYYTTQYFLIGCEY